MAGCMECDFCSELYNEPNLYSEVAERCNLPEDRIIYEGKHWVVWPTIGAIVPGYVLIVLKRHSPSVMACDGEEIGELECLLERTRSMLETIYHTPCIVFEHGNGCGAGMRSACIDHCHMHVLPLKEDIYDRINFQRMKMEAETIDSLSSLLKYNRRQESYLLYQNHEGEFFVLHADTYLSQYFRQLIALSVGMPEKWNWRQYYFSENMRQTLQDMKRVFI